MANDLPPGFKLDEETEGLPPGFTLDSTPVPSASVPADEPKSLGGFFRAVKEGKRQATEAVAKKPGLRGGGIGSALVSQVPETPGEAVTTGLMTAAAPLAAPAAAGMGLVGKVAPALLRILSGAGAGAAGAAVDQKDIGSGALLGGGVTAGMEGVGPLIGAFLRYGPGAAARISEQIAKRVRGVAESVVPEFRPTIEANKSAVRPTLLGGKTTAALEETALGKSGKDTLSNVMEQGMLDTTLAAQGQGIRSPALNEALGVLRHVSGGDPLFERSLPGLLPNPHGEYTVTQAEEIIARIGSAMKSSPLDRKINDRDLTALYGKMLNETVQSLPPQAAEVFAAARDKYRGGTAILDLLREANSRRGSPNRIRMNDPAIMKSLSENRAELRTKLGSDFDRLVDAVAPGAQIGTRGINTPGSGETMSAFRQLYGRGQGGAPQIIGSVARTGLPNLGYQPTGNAPYSAPEGLKAILDILGTVGAARASSDLKQRAGLP
jgi:hypothetical protein